MILNLNKLNKYNKISTKICIIGAGTAGLFLASQLSSKKKEVIIIEAGDEHATSFVRKYFKINSNTQHYINNKNENSRAFGIGGTSTIWGGFMVPMQRSEFEKNSLFSWPIKFKDLQKYYSIVKKKLKIEIIDLDKNSNSTNLIKKNYNLKFFKKIFNLNFGIYLNKNKKNFYNTFIKKKNDIGLIYSNSRVFKINNLEKKKNNKFSVKNILAKSNNGNILDIQAEIFILCCGAIKSTRLMHICNIDNKNFLSKKKISLGNNFSEQLKIYCGTFYVKNWIKFREFFSPIYWKNSYQFPRLILKSNLKKIRNRSITCQFVYDRPNKDWINIFKLFIRNQFNYKYFVSILKLTPKIILDIYNFFYLRKIKKIWWFQKVSKINLYLFFDQNNRSSNKLIIKKDLYKEGRVNNTFLLWKINKEDIKTVKIFCQIFKDFWQKTGLQKIAYFKPIPKNSHFICKSLKAIYHPTGSLMTGKNNSNSVTDENLRFRYLENLYICSTAVFPFGGSANTGLTLLALAARLSDYIKKKLIYEVNISTKILYMFWII